MVLLSILTFRTNLLAAGQVIDTGSDSIQGIWSGELIIPDQAKLRLAVIITGNCDSARRAFLNIIDQATGNIPCDDIIYSNDSVTVSLKGLGIKIKGVVDLTGNILESHFMQAGASFPVTFTRVGKLPELLRPQEPKPPFPYSAEDITFENKTAGIRLAGTLTIPDKKGKHPAVILVSGSGQQDRNEEIGRHKPFWVIADYLTRHGIVVLRYDDRGIGGSGGNFDLSTSGDFAGDVLSGIVYLKGRKEINADQIGIIGHSEGGVVASIAASESDNVAFIITLAGLMKNFEDVVLEQLLDQSRQQGRNEEDIELERNWRMSIYDIAKEKTDSAAAAKKLWKLFDRLPDGDKKRLNWPRGRHESQIAQVLEPWWRYNLSLDNRSILMKVKCPLLALYGELDRQVNADENIPFVEETLKKAGNGHFEIMKMPGLNHMFQKAGTGSEYEYIRIEETISPEALQLMCGWIDRTTN